MLALIDTTVQKIERTVFRYANSNKNVLKSAEKHIAKVRQCTSEQEVFALENKFNRFCNLKYPVDRNEIRNLLNFKVLLNLEEFIDWRTGVNIAEYAIEIFANCSNIATAKNMTFIDVKKSRRGWLKLSHSLNMLGVEMPSPALLNTNNSPYFGKINLNEMQIGDFIVDTKFVGMFVGSPSTNNTYNKVNGPLSQYISNKVLNNSKLNAYRLRVIKP